MPKKKLAKWQLSKGILFLLIILLLITVIFPLTAILSKLTETDIIKYVSTPKFLQALLQSITVSGLTTFISMTLAALLAWCTSRTSIRYKNIFTLLLTIPMLIPSMSHGMGLIILLGSNGILTNFLEIHIQIYGFLGIILGSVMYSLPVAYLMLLDILRFEDSTPYEAASVMGLCKKDILFAITLPYLRKPLISVFFATFTLVITDYGVPLMVGGKYNTLPVLMYQDVIGMLDFGKGSVIGIFLLIPALCASLFDIFNKDNGNHSFVYKPFIIKPQKLRDFFAYAVCIIICFLLLLPIFTFSIVAFIKKYPIDMTFSLDNIRQALGMNAGDYLCNSLLIAICVTVLGVLLAIICSYFTARMPLKASKLLHLLAITPLAIPGIVLGLSYVLFFKKSFIYGTFALLILVNTMHFFSSPYLMMYNVFSKLNYNLEAVGKTLGINRFHMLKDVLLPMSAGTILEMASYFFVNSMMTISAVSFLASTANKPISLMITQFEGQMQLECAAFVSFIILLVNICFKGIISLIRKHIA